MRLESYKGYVERLIELVDEGFYPVEELLPKLKEISKRYADEYEDECEGYGEAG